MYKNLIQRNLKIIFVTEEKEHRLARNWVISHQKPRDSCSKPASSRVLQ
jgi:ABC-type phosphonate transport system ATPase subunit